MTEAVVGAEWTPLFEIERPSAQYPNAAPYFRCRGCGRYGTTTPSAQIIVFPGYHRRYCEAWKEKRVQYINGKWWLKGEAKPWV